MIERLIADQPQPFKRGSDLKPPSYRLPYDRHNVDTPALLGGISLARYYQSE
jgi:hypothetical protein